MAAIRLLLFTKCRRQEILNLQWNQVDFERGALFLPNSKTGRRTVILGAPAMKVLSELPHVGPFVISGADPEKARTALKRPWNAIRRRANLNGVRLHDLRHSFASVGAGAGLGLPIIGLWVIRSPAPQPVMPTWATILFGAHLKRFQLEFPLRWEKLPARMPRSFRCDEAQRLI